MDDKIKTKIVFQALQLFEGDIKIKEIKKIMPLLFPKQNESNIEMIVEKSIEMCSSLQRATDEAGGSGWSLEALCDMSVIDLISTLGTNNVRFIYTKANIKEYKKGEYTAKHKLTEIKIFAGNMFYEFTEQLKTNPDNLVAAMAVDIYKEILQKF